MNIMRKIVLELAPRKNTLYVEGTDGEVPRWNSV